MVKGAEGVYYRRMIRVHGCIAWHWWHLTLSSSFVTYYVSRSNMYCCPMKMQISFGAFLLSLFIKYQWSKNFTENVHPNVPK